MSLVMDAPVNLPQTIAAAKRRVVSSAKTGSKGGAQGPLRSVPLGTSKKSSQNTFCHGITAASVALLGFIAGYVNIFTAIPVTIALTAAMVVLDLPNPLQKALIFVNTARGQESARQINVNNWIDGYNELHNKDSDYVKSGDKAGVEQRNSSYQKLVNSYYELATLFYEVGWGTSFHFATKRKGETFKESIKRHEYFLASKLGGNLQGKKIVDVGCGVGGPYRNIAKFTGADVTGITLNEYQVQRGNKLSANDGLTSRCRSVQGDFMKMPFDNESFDAAYAIEATCHAPHRNGVYSEIYRVLKPGAVCAMYEWCLTPKYDPNNPEHRLIKKQIEEGDGLPDMALTTEIDDAVKEVGFEVLESRDIVLDELPGDTTWYHPLTPSWNIFSQRFQFTNIGKWLTTNGLKLLEFIRLAPAGTCKVQKMLLTGGLGCVRGGETGIFTPMYMVVVRKPLK